MNYQFFKIACLKLIVLFFSMSYTISVLGGQVATIGQAANNMAEPFFIVTNLFYIFYLMVGVGLVTLAIVKIIERRINPDIASLTQIILLLITGLSVLLIPYFLFYNNGDSLAAPFISMFT